MANEPRKPLAGLSPKMPAPKHASAKGAAAALPIDPATGEPFVTQYPSVFDDVASRHGMAKGRRPDAIGRNIVLGGGMSGGGLMGDTAGSSLGHGISRLTG